MMQRLVSVMVLLLLITAAVPSSKAQADRLQVVASYNILADVVENVAGDAADVTSVMPRGADPHSFVPTPSDLTALADADVVFVNGALFEEGLMEAIENAGADMNIVTVSSCVQILPFGGHAHEDDEHEHEEDEAHQGDEHTHEADDDHAHEGEMSPIAMMCEEHYAEMHALHEDAHENHEEGENHEHEEGEEHAHEHGEGETLGALYAVDCGMGHEHEGDEHSEEAHEEGEAHEHSHGACDPHVWTEPHNVMYWTMFIRDTLTELDPANADAYTANAAAYLEQLDALAHDFIIPMVDTVPEENRVIVTNHGSLGYFAHSYGFEIVTTIIPGGGTMVEPSAADVAAVIDLIRAENVPAIFAETTVSDRIAQQIAAETGAEVAVLYTGSLSDADGPASTYLDYIRYNVTTIVEALGGGM